MNLPESMVRAMERDRETLNALFRVKKSMHRSLRADDFYAVLFDDRPLLAQVGAKRKQS